MFRRKTPPLPPLPERPPDLYVDGRAMWIVIPRPDRQRERVVFGDESIYDHHDMIVLGDE